ADAFRACLEQAAADDGVDAVIVVAVPTAIADLSAAAAAAAVRKPLILALPDQAETVRLRERAETGTDRDATPSPADPGDKAETADAPTQTPALDAVPA